MSVALIVVTLLAFLVGVGLVPGIVYLVAPSLGVGGRTILARILYTIAALSVSGTTLYQRASGVYDLLPLMRFGGELMAVDTKTGDRIDLDDDIGWSRLGKRPFGVTWEKDKDAFDGTLKTESSATPLTDGGQEDAVTDHGNRAGFPVVSTASSGPNQFVVDVFRTMKRLENAATGEAAVEAERAAMKEYGGDTSQLQMKWMMFGILAALISGAGMAYVVMGGI